jgi:hypothetical protein
MTPGKEVSKSRLYDLCNCCKHRLKGGPIKPCMGDTWFAAHWNIALSCLPFQLQPAGNWTLLQSLIGSVGKSDLSVLIGWQRFRCMQELMHVSVTILPVAGLAECRSASMGDVQY